MAKVFKCERGGARSAARTMPSSSRTWSATSPKRTPKLGLTPTEERPEGLTYECAGGSALFLFPTAISGRGGHTQAGIEVPDVKAAVAELESRGVVFEDYDAPGERAAWFKDSEGNLLGLVQFA